MRELFHPSIDQLDLPAILSALSDPIRLGIMRSLIEQKEKTCACCISVLPKSALSHHFKVLREAGLINVRVEGTQRFLSIRHEDLEKRFPGLLSTILKFV